jgi:hypothetical protein
MGIRHEPEERNITFHSLKKMGVEYVLEMTGDLTLAAKQGNHSNIQTTNKYYTNMKDKENIGSMLGLQMGNKIDTTELEGLSREELLKLILESDNSTKQSLLKQLRKG